jgi:hypothetical protein
MKGEIPVAHTDHPVEGPGDDQGISADHLDPSTEGDLRDRESGSSSDLPRRKGTAL